MTWRTSTPCRSDECASTTIRAGSAAEAQAADDLADARKDELRHVLIIGREPDVDVRLEDRRAVATCTSDDDSARRLADDIADLLAPARRSRLHGHVVAWLVLVGTVAAAAGLSVALYLSEHTSGAAQWAALALGLAAMVALISVEKVVRFPISSAIVVPMRRGESRSLKYQVRHTWAAQVIGGTLVLGVGIAVGHFWPGS